MEKLTCDCNIIHYEVVKEAAANKLTPTQLRRLTAIFKVLGDTTRINILWALMGREMCVCDLAATVCMTKSAISHQLKTMRDAGIVKSRRDGKNIFYSLDDNHVTEMLTMAYEHIKHK